MSNYEDFDLDLKKIRNKGVDVTPAATDGVICTIIIEKTIEYSISKYKDSLQNCTRNCEYPSIDYEHRSCRGPLNDGTIQINC